MDSNPLEWKAPIMGFLLWASWVVMSYHNQRKVTETNQSQFLYKSSRCFYTLKYPSHSFCPNIDFSWPTWTPKTCFHLLTHSPPTQTSCVLPHSGLFSFSLMLMTLSALHQVVKGLCHWMCPASSSLFSILQAISCVNHSRHILRCLSTLYFSSASCGHLQWGSLKNDHTPASTESLFEK